MISFIRMLRFPVPVIAALALLLAACPSENSGGDGTYRVRTGTLPHGEIIPYPEEGTEGTSIELTVYADEDCSLVPGSLYYRPLPDGEPVPIPIPAGEERTFFTLPASDVEVGAEFTSLEELSRRMIRVPGNTVGRKTGLAGSPFYGAGDSPVEVKGFKLAAVEVPYRLWYTVRLWAEHEDRGANRYSISKHSGRPGSSDTSGEIPQPTRLNKYSPVVRVSWWDAVVWCNAYSDWAREVMGENTQPVYKKDGQVLRTSPSATPVPDQPAFNAPGYRLPTEAEWEFAARGGDSTAEAWNYTYPGGDHRDEIAWYAGNAEGMTHWVGLKAPNSLGLYDMSGNAEEWCWDSYAGTSRVVRGGHHGAFDVSLTLRGGSNTNTNTNSTGFRIAGPLN